MAEDLPTVKHVTIDFDIIENIGVDTSTIKVKIEDQVIGYLNSLEFSADIHNKFGKLQYTLFRNVRGTNNINDTGIWDLHSHGDTETND